MLECMYACAQHGVAVVVLDRQNPIGGEICEGPMLAVVSLLRNDEVEVRLMKPPAAPTGSATEPPPAGFALFQLTRHKSDCGF